MGLSTGDKDKILFLHRDPLFDRCLDDLRKKRGTALMAVKKVNEIIRYLTQQEGQSAREKFGLTWNGEYRIRNCKKIDLVCGYRLVCIKKGCHLILLYVGSHDDCFRWIERNKGLTYEVEHATHVVKISRDSIQRDDSLPKDVLEEQRYIKECEEKVRKRLDDNVLCKIFSGLCNKTTG